MYVLNRGGNGVYSPMDHGRTGIDSDRLEAAKDTIVQCLSDHVFNC